MRLIAYRHQDESERVGYFDESYSSTFVWLFGYQRKPLYAIRVRWKHL